MLRWLILIVATGSLIGAFVQTRLFLAYIGLRQSEYGQSPLLALSALNGILSGLARGLILLLVSWPQLLTWYFLTSAIISFIMIWPRRMFYRSLLESNLSNDVPLVTNMGNEVQNTKVAVLIWTIAMMASHQYFGF